MDAPLGKPAPEMLASIRDDGELPISDTNELDDDSRTKIGLNFFVMNWHQILMRTGWIFKTESLVMPAVLDMVGGSAWLRGMLPMLNRFGQSVPPLLVANSIRNSPRKKYRLIVSSMTMGSVFCLLSFLWQFRDLVSSATMIAVILVLYAIFFSSLGVNQLILSALIGKLIPVVQRGRLMQFSSVIGSLIAISCAWVLLNTWLTEQDPNFGAIFLFAGLLFVAAGAIAVFFKESKDLPPRQQLTLRTQLIESIQVMRHDKNFGVLAIAAALFGMMMTLFPHYQAVGRQRLNLGFDSLVPWIVAQNLGVAFFSLPAGWIADRYGNRLALKLLMGGLFLVPLASLFLSGLGSTGAFWYFMVFAMLGLTPVAIRTFNNYTLELVNREQHPKYLSLLSLFIAGPAVLGSLIVGALIDRTGYEFAFILVSGLQFIGFGLCFLLNEPRKMATNIESIA